MHDFVRGDIVRHGDHWGVVRSAGFEHGPVVVDWWVGRYAAGKVELWLTHRGCIASELSAPFANDYPGIPDQVVARSMAIILEGEHA